MPFARVLCTAHAVTLSRSVQTRPPCTTPIGLYDDSSGRQVKTTSPSVTLLTLTSRSPPMGAPGRRFSATAVRKSRPLSSAPAAAVCIGSYQVTVLLRGSPQDSMAETVDAADFAVHTQVHG